MLGFRSWGSSQGSDRLKNTVTRQYSQITPGFHPPGRGYQEGGVSGLGFEIFERQTAWLRLDAACPPRGPGGSQTLKPPRPKQGLGFRVIYNP